MTELNEHMRWDRGSILLVTLIAALVGALGWIAPFHILIVLLLVILATLASIAAHWMVTAEYPDTERL